MKKIKKKIIQKQKSKKILLGVSAGISLYKSITLLRLLVKENFEVKVIMTPEAANFINPIFFSTLSRNNVYVDFVKNNKWENHVDLGLWADLMIIAPATANTLAKLANGYSDNFLIATYLSIKSDVFVFPSMDRDMYNHETTRSNILKILKNQFIVEPNSGELASGLIGQGRLPEPEEILGYVNSYFDNKNKLKGKRVLITAGPTYEFLDTVRYISNMSSGKMGLSLAKAAISMGAEVDLVIGPNNLNLDIKGINVTEVISADEMYNKVLNLFPRSDLSIMAAAVSDYKKKEILGSKIKKDNSVLNLQLIKNKDIILEMSKIKKKKQLLVGFALEDNNEILNAKKKLINKKLDMIILNSLNDEGAGFMSDTNKVKLMVQDSIVNVGLDTKDNVAKYIFDFIYQEFIDNGQIKLKV